MLRQLLMLAGLVATGLVAAPAVAKDYCVASADAFRQAVSQARFTRSADTIRVVAGVLDFGAAGFTGSTSFPKSLRIEGGWNADCTARTEAADATVLHGGGLGRFVMRTCGDTVIERLTLSGFVHATAAVDLVGENANCWSRRSVILRDAIVTGNSGAVALRLHNAFEGRVINTLVHGNTATAAALRIETSGSSETDIVHTTVAHNSGPGIEVTTMTQRARIWNSISFGNGGTDLVIGSPASPTELFHVLAGSVDGTASAGSLPVLQADPQFVSAAGGDFRLAAASPAVNAGGAATMEGGFARDLAGQPRWQGSRPDLGAFESAVDGAIEFVVTSEANSGAGSLRQAISDANAAGMPARIVFAIPGGCGREIAVLSPLPAVSGTVLIDGFSQPGSAPSTAPLAIDAVHCITLRTNSMLSAPLANGLHVADGSSASLAVRGLRLTDFVAAVHLEGGADHVVSGSRFDGGGKFDGNQFAVRVGSNASRVLVGGASPAARNLIGASAVAGVLTEGNDRMQMVANNFVGLTADGLGAAANAIGLATLGTRAYLRGNFVSGNTSSGIVLSGAGHSRVHGNWVGLSTAMTPLGNGGAGVHVYSGSNHVGGPHGLGNTIAHNAGAGVWVDLGVSNTVIGNRVFANDTSGQGWLSIDLDLPGPLVNDDLDADNGPNLLQNHPVITEITLDPATLSYTLHYTLNTTPNRSVLLSAYSHHECPASGRGDSSDSLRAVSAFVGASGTLSGTMLMPRTEFGAWFTMTATVENSTSEPSECVQGPPFAKNTRLAGLLLSAVALPFDPDVLSYTLSVGWDVMSTTVTAVTEDAEATLTIAGVPLASGETSAPIALATGANQIPVEVTARDGITTFNHLVTLVRANDGADLVSLEVDAGSFTPAFDRATSVYSMSVPSATTSIRVRATPLYAGTQLTVRRVTSQTPIPFLAGEFSPPVPLSSGDNVIEVRGESSDGSIFAPYFVLIHREPAAEARLASIGTSAGVLSPGFDAEIAHYTVEVPFPVSSLTLWPVAQDADATVRHDGLTVPPHLGRTLSLGVGTTSAVFTVTAADGVTTREYTVDVVRAQPTSIALSALSISTGILSPAFAPSMTQYSATVGNDVASLVVTAATEDPAAALAIAGTAVMSGQPSAPIPLLVGSNDIVIEVSAADGHGTGTVTVTVTREADSNARLAALVPSSGALQPAFSPGHGTYAIEVAHSVDELTLTASAEAADATITVAGIPVASGTASAPIALVVGTTGVPVTVTAADGMATNTYTITITRRPPPSAALSGIVLQVGSPQSPSYIPLAPAFSPSQYDYTASAAHHHDTLRVIAFAAEPGAMISVNGTAVTSGVPGGPIALPVGESLVFVDAVSADGGDVRQYRIAVTRAASSNAALAALVPSHGTLSPAFSPDVTAYAMSVANDVATLGFTATAADPAATITVAGQPSVSGEPSAQVPLLVGTHPLTISVTAQSGSTRNYVITVTRAPDANARLASLVPSAGSLQPAFHPDVTAYALTVPNAVSSMTLTLQAQAPGAVVKIGGNSVGLGTPTAPIMLAPGSTTVDIVVTAPDGVTTRSYALTVQRLAGDETRLAALAVGSGTLSPAFDPEVAQYSVTVAHDLTALSVYALAVDPAAEVRVAGQLVVPGAPTAYIPLDAQPAPIPVTVKAGNGDERTYVIDVSRAHTPGARVFASGFED